MTTDPHSDPYRGLARHSSEWIDAEPGLRDWIPRWSSEPRAAEELVGALDRPTIGHLASAGRMLTRLPRLNRNAIEAVLHGSRRSENLPIARRLLRRVATRTASASGPAGRSLVAVLDRLSPSVAPTDPNVAEPPPPLAPAVVRQIIPAETGDRLSSLDDSPYAFGEFDQAHHARLDDGRPAVLVVSRPGIARSLIDDARLVAPWLIGIELLDRSPWRDGLVDIVHDATATAVRRVDQRAVALDAVMLAVALERGGNHDVAIARPMPDLVSRDTAVYALPTGSRSAFAPVDRRSVVTVGISTIVETGLVQGVFATHLDRQHVWTVEGTPTLVGGTTVSTLDAATRLAIARLLAAATGNSGAADALIALGAVPRFVDREALDNLLVDARLLDPMALLTPPTHHKRGDGWRELVTRHRARPTSELTRYGWALARFAAAIGDEDEPVSLPEIAVHALPRLAGIGARINDAA